MLPRSGGQQVTVHGRGWAPRATDGLSDEWFSNTAHVQCHSVTVSLHSRFFSSGSAMLSAPAVIKLWKTGSATRLNTYGSLARQICSHAIQFNSVQFNSRSYLLRVEHDQLTKKLFSAWPTKKKRKKRDNKSKRKREKKKGGHKRKHDFMK